MRILALGGCGLVGKVVVKELLERTEAEIVIGDQNLDAAKNYVSSLNSKKVTANFVNANDKAELVSLLNDFDIISDCTGIRDSRIILESAIESKTNYVCMTGAFHKEKFELDDKAKDAEITAILAMGTSPGITNILAKYGADQLDQVDEIKIDYIIYHPIDESRGCVDSSLHQFWKEGEGRDTPYYKDGKFFQAPVFSGEREIHLPEPFGYHKTYYMSHAEPYMLSRSIKGAKLIELRGGYPPAFIEDMKFFLKYNFLSTKPINVNGHSIAPRDFLTEHLLVNSKKYNEKTIGHVDYIEVIGIKNGGKTKYTYIVTQPEEWGLDTLALATGIPGAIGISMLAEGKVTERGVLSPEMCIDPEYFLNQLSKTGIRVTSKVETYSNC
jgi:lysine 6-dehydrogenase